MTRDQLGNEITDTAPDLVAAINDFLHGVLAYQTQAVTLMGLIEDHPGSCLGNTYTGFLWMFLESPAAPALAAPYLERALKAAGTPREKANAQVLAAWVAGDIPETIRRCEAIAREYPTDLAIIKLGQYHLFNLGDASGMLRMALHALPACAAMPYVHGMIAFGYEQCHLMADAEASARRAIAIEPTDPWAHHALAHVMLTQARVDEGIAFLEEVAPTWQGLNSFMHTHNWWHLALFYISRDRQADVLATYDAHVWACEKDYSQDQIGAASLLARMEFAGIDVGDRWADVADRIAARGADTVSPFLTLQYLYALARAGRPEAETLMDAIRTRAATTAHDQAAWADVALPAATGIIAHAAGDAATAARALGRALPRLQEIGGSHAQRDFFDQIHLDALIKAGEASTAQQVLEMRRTYDPDGIPLNRLLAQVYEQVGLPEQARQARARAGG
ncbi:tetratricopeptide repeat protein [Pararhodobacter zhoushanensis]|uniref:Tetratricopeptide repeat protein 38 n=1 Tax=Pararhodobacter zhoushanensis TaxID=2479545 RepID=A0ABT3GYA0_9RHOB|nr:tetratricopeptide repeat protein [Pararhodobacter zhoushanensis]MCW1932507.1 tetratricopeptide repeat protein [Pararhodobacter zhoushanensis]